MKYSACIFIFLVITGFRARSQETQREGAVSYITTQSVYVKFASTEGIQAGDTLYATQSGLHVPALVVRDLSSVSCVCSPISAMKFETGLKVFSLRDIGAKPVKADVPSVMPAGLGKIDTVIASVPAATPKIPVHAVSGRLSLASYTGFSSVSDFSQRMRYTLSFNARNISGSKLSAETYVSFSHRFNDGGELRDNIFNGLKVYNLALHYGFNKNQSAWLGRRINPMLSNAGAVDGIQYEAKIRSFTAGIVAGSRPDYRDYGFNFNLVQYGGYLSHDIRRKKGNMQTSAAFMEQHNQGNVDRRFTYFQHANSLVSNLYFFSSFEFDLYNKVRNLSDSTYRMDQAPKLSNLYLSARYRVVKQLTLSLSYSERTNIIYYETYKDIIDRLLETARMQGFNAQVQFRPHRNISAGLSAGYRDSPKDPRPSKNLHSYITHANVPVINSSVTLSATLAETGYLSSSIYSLGFSKDFLPGKLYGGANYRYVQYKFVSAETPLKQQMAELNLNWRIVKKLTLSMNYEGTFQKGDHFERIYINLTQKF